MSFNPDLIPVEERLLLNTDAAESSLYFLTCPDMGSCRENFIRQLVERKLSEHFPNRDVTPLLNAYMSLYRDSKEGTDFSEDLIARVHTAAIRFIDGEDPGTVLEKSK